MQRKTLAITLLFFALCMYLLSYGYVAWFHQEVNLLSTIIHENGRLTLIGTIFQYDHIVGQWPFILLLSVFSVGGFLYYGAPVKKLNTKKVAASLFILLTGLSILIFFASTAKVGFEETLNIFSQSKERDLVYSNGGNWKLALSSLVTSGFLAFLFAAGIRYCLEEQIKKQKSWLYVTLFGIGVTLVLSILFQVDGSALLDDKFLAHSGREIVNNGIIVFPLIFSSLLFWEQRIVQTSPKQKNISFSAVVIAGIFVLLFLAHVFLLRGTSISAVGQMPSFAPDGISLPYLIASHVLEHTIDYFLMIFIAVATYLAVMSRR